MCMQMYDKKSKTPQKKMLQSDFVKQQYISGICVCAVANLRLGMREFLVNRNFYERSAEIPSVGVNLFCRSAFQASYAAFGVEKQVGKLFAAKAVNKYENAKPNLLFADM